MMTHQELEGMAAELATAVECRQRLTVALRQRLLAVAAELAPALREAAGAERDCCDALLEAVRGAPDLFAKPRTRTVHGIRYGWQLGKPSIEIADEAKTIKRIRETVNAAQQELLIRVTERVDRRAVLDLTAADLRRLGIRQLPGEDLPVVSLPKDGVDRLVETLLAEQAEVTA